MAVRVQHDISVPFNPNQQSAVGVQAGGRLWGNQTIEFAAETHSCERTKVSYVHKSCNINFPDRVTVPFCFHGTC